MVLYIAAHGTGLNEGMLFGLIMSMTVGAMDGIATKKNGDRPFYTWGIYLDDWTSGTKVYGNIIARTFYGGVVIHGGKIIILKTILLLKE